MSLRTRLFATYALIVVICLAVVASVITVLLQGYRDRLTMERLDNIARPISVQVRSLVLGEVTPAKLWANLEEQAQKNDVHIILGSRDGNVVRQIAPQPGQAVEVPSGGLPHGISKAVQGRFVTVDSRTFIYAAYPLGRLASTLETRFETLVLAAPQTGSVAILASLFRPLFLAGFVALVVSLIVAILFARSVYRPIKRVTNAARKVAEGDYTQRIPVTGPGEVRELAASFNHMSEQVERAQQQLRHFVADVSHELKSPLTSIQGFAQAMVDGTAGDDDTRSKAARIINDESRRMRRQVNELLELARMQSGQMKIASEPVELNELLHHCCEVFELQARERGILLRLDTVPSVTVSGDSDRLEQLFGNLLDNAIKNTPGGEVRVASRQLAGGQVEVRVSDNGPGIPPEQLQYVFERFYQVTGVRTGVGLGLAIAREIALAHGGTIEARSEPGQGAEFIVRLPAVPGQS
ncbi:MAG: HAMP domain-containing histidine kinase [Chloroflexi bacterium]|nr:HAMP domain-containing histidine kinase [Chloroflexota bacterium]